ncbi:hypothetical protein ACJ72_01344 [Emergomyces africanus]|uniref:DNA replication checkpoint mediator MRC1 domain-containing protein n=1 Tax=Emergomyces africanus TaxID=1955775 RepID=A0A1B7P5K3_9EURO|nr:hypothetical protein ACJ72_01344 [Emergomyces africanus]
MAIDMEIVPPPSQRHPTRSSATPDRDVPSGDDGDNAGVNSPAMLTPGAKIRAIMAAYDTDTESEGELQPDAKGAAGSPSNPGNSYADSKLNKKPVSRPLFTSFTAASAYPPREEDGIEEEEYELPVLPKGKMAARMQASVNGQAESADEGISKEMMHGKESIMENVNGARSPSSAGERADEDEDVHATTRRRSSVAPTVSRRSYSPLFVPEGSPKPNKTMDEGMETDEEVRTATRRRALDRGRRSASVASNRSFSPLFVSQDSLTAKSNSGLTRDAMGSDGDEAGDEADGELGPSAHNRLIALVEKKRKEREAREQLEAEKKAARLQRSNELEETLLSSDRLGDDDDDSESGRKLTQHSRPSARKASKKALLEMHRETQRMSRNMQLAHQAATKKKITLDSFLTKFNSKSSNLSAAVATTSSAPASSDHEDQQHRHSTPPTSPLEHGNLEEDKPAPAGIEDKHKEVSVRNDDDDIYIPSVEVIFAGSAPVAQTPADPSRQELERSKAPSVTPAPGSSSKATRPVRVRLSRQSVAENQKNYTDSDLEIVTSPGKTRRIAVFENLPARNNQSSSTLLKLRNLAQLTSPTRQQHTAMMTRSELDSNLFRRARLQALKERQERIEELRAKGVVVESAEERMRVHDEVEDLLEKARAEAEEIAKREKKAAKKDGGDVDVVDLDDSEDGDFDGGDEEEEVVLSGSEEEGEDITVSDDEEVEDEELEEGDDAPNDAGTEGTRYIHNEVDEAAASEAETELSELDDRQVKVTDGEIPRRSRRRVISDDEDEEEVKDTTPKPQETPVRSSHPQPLFPNFGATRTPIMGLTQAFGATFADSQDNEEDSLAMLRRMPETECPVDQLLLERDSQEIVRDSQGQDSVPLDIFASYPRADGEDRVSESPAARTVTSYSQAPEPTQDAGFVYSPFDQGKRFTDVHVQGPSSTIDTVPVDDNQSPIARRTGGRRLLRRGPVAELSDVDEVEDEGFLVKSSAFDVMRKAAKNKNRHTTTQTPFDKTKSKARDIIDEVAEESEDEYAGLGGASDESAGEEDEIDLSMINDDSGEVVDEKELAALNANHSRQQDEQQVNKLMRDITTGALRRRRGAGGDDLDLSDSDDERLAARRRAKRREFEKMRKALLADEKIGKIAVDPKKSAFLRTIEDRDVDNDVPMMDFLENGNTSSSQDTSSQDNTTGHHQQQHGEGDDESAEQGDVSNGINNKRKRPLDQSDPDALNRRAPPHMRRTAESAIRKKPLTLAEIRESVSFLLEGDESNSSEFPGDILLSDEETEGDSRLHHRRDEITREQPEDDLETNLISAENSDNNDNHNGDISNDDKHIQPATGTNHIHPRRRPRGKVVDRLSLRRQASSNAASGSTTTSTSSTSTTSSTTSSGPRPAFFSSDSTPPFKRPPLIRRATSSLSTTSSSSSSSGSAAVTYGAGLTGSASMAVSVSESRSGMQLQGNKGKKGSVNYYAAARERQREWELRKAERLGEQGGSAKGQGKKGGKPAGGVLGGLLGGGVGSDFDFDFLFPLS